MDHSYASQKQLLDPAEGSIRVYPNHQSDDYPPHWHDAWELIHPIENGYTVQVQGALYEVAPGGLLVIPSGIVHEIYAPDHGQRCILLLDADELYAVEGFQEVMPRFCPCVLLSPERDGALLDALIPHLVRVMQEHEQGEPLSRAVMRAELSLLLLGLARAMVTGRLRTPSVPVRSADSMMMDVCSYIAAHCQETLSLEEMAAYAGYSRYHFTRLFRRHTGMTFYQYYMKQRLLFCRHLLMNTAVPITEAAMRAGFSSIATFNRVFRQFEGMTPTEYRRSFPGPRPEAR